MAHNVTDLKVREKLLLLINLGSKDVWANELGPLYSNSFHSSQFIFYVITFILYHFFTLSL